jgi:hypothetical protein
MTTAKTDKTVKTGKAAPAAAPAPATPPAAARAQRPVQRTRLSHVQYHQVATYVAGCVDPGTDSLSCTPSQLVQLVQQDCELFTNPGQLREMCKSLGLTIRNDKPGAADVAALTQLCNDLATAVKSTIDSINELHKRIGNIDSQLEDLTGVESPAEDLAKIKAVLNDHAKRLSAWQPVGPAADLLEQQQQ